MRLFLEKQCLTFLKSTFLNAGSRCTILNVESRTRTVRALIQLLLTKNLAGGWEEALLSALSEDGDSLKDIKL